MWWSKFSLSAKLLRHLLPQTISKMNEIQDNKKYKYLSMIDLDFLDQSFRFILFNLMRQQIVMIPNWALGHISRKRIWKSIGSSFSFQSHTSSSYRYWVTLFMFFQKFCCHSFSAMWIISSLNALWYLNGFFAIFHIRKKQKIFPLFHLRTYPWPPITH